MWPIFKKYHLGESQIPQKYRELLMLAVSAAIKCPYSILYHREAARMMGASEDELAEVTMLVSSTGFWSDVLHSMNYDKDKFAKELEKAGEHLITSSQE
jgi:AhpD family alkylhydroperoxidase